MSWVKLDAADVPDDELWINPDHVESIVDSWHGGQAARITTTSGVVYHIRGTVQDVLNRLSGRA